MSDLLFACFCVGWIIVMSWTIQWLIDWILNSEDPSDRPGDGG